MSYWKNKDFWKFGGSAFNIIVIIGCATFIPFDIHDHHWFALGLDVLALFGLGYVELLKLGNLL